MLYQQGDVLIEEIDNIPENAKKVSPIRGRIVLAEGEMTGHAHVITDVRNNILLDHSGDLFLHTLADATVTHEEHHAIQIPPGKYKINRVQEYNHFDEEAKAVQD